MKISFKNRLITYHITVVCIIVLTSVIYIFQREKDYSLSAKQNELVSYNKEIHKSYKSGISFNEIDIPNNIILTVLDTNAIVIFDNNIYENSIGKNLSGRKEILRAAVNGEASLLKHSDEVNKDFLFYVKKYPNLYIRTALVYADEDLGFVKRDRSYIALLIGLLLLVIISSLIISKKLNKPFKFFLI
jgi:hypothetical protein